MVTVVKPQEEKQVKCRKCGSVLEYVFTEIQERIVGDYGGGRDTYRLPLALRVQMKLVYERILRMLCASCKFLCYNAH